MCLYVYIYVCSRYAHTCIYNTNLIDNFVQIFLSDSEATSNFPQSFPY